MATKTSAILVSFTRFTAFEQSKKERMPGVWSDRKLGEGMEVSINGGTPNWMVTNG